MIEKQHGIEATLDCCIDSSIERSRDTSILLQQNQAKTA